VSAALAVHCDGDIRTHSAAQSTAVAAPVGVCQCSRAVAFGVETFGHGDDVLRASGGAQLAALAAFLVDDDVTHALLLCADRSSSTGPILIGKKWRSRARTEVRTL
jgi:hypothetical protein